MSWTGEHQRIHEDISAPVQIQENKDNKLNELDNPVEKVIVHYDDDTVRTWEIKKGTECMQVKKLKNIIFHLRI